MLLLEYDYKENAKKQYTNTNHIQIIYKTKNCYKSLYNTSLGSKTI